MNASAIRSMCSALLSLALAIGMTAPALAQGLQNDDATLAKEAKKVDAAASRPDSARATDRLVAEFSDVRIKASAADPGRPPTSADVQALRAQGLGYGEIAIVLSLYAHQSGATFYTLEQASALKQPGQGWGRVAKLLGYSSLGAALRDVKRAGKAVESGSKTAVRPEVPKKLEKPDKPEKPEKPQKIEKPERPERAGR